MKTDTADYIIHLAISIMLVATGWASGILAFQVFALMYCAAAATGIFVHYTVSKRYTFLITIISKCAKNKEKKVQR